MEQVNSGGMTFISSEKENEIYNRKIPYLELVKGKKTPYAYTALADIEKSLSSMKLDFIIWTSTISYNKPHYLLQILSIITQSRHFVLPT